MSIYVFLLNVNIMSTAKTMEGKEVSFRFPNKKHKCQHILIGSIIIVNIIIL